MSVSFADLNAMWAQRPEWNLLAQEKTPQILAQLLAQGLELLPAEQQQLQALAAAQNKPWAQIKHPRVALYAAPYHEADAVQLRAQLNALNNSTAAQAQLCALLRADLRVYELGVEEEQTPLDETMAAHAVSYGLMAVEQGVDLLIAGCLSPLAAHAALAWHKDLLSDRTCDPFASLLQHGNADLFAAFGAVLAARMARIPVLCDALLAPVFVTALQNLSGTIAGADHCLLVAAQSVASLPTIGALLSAQRLQALLALGPTGSQLTQIAKAA